MSECKRFESTIEAYVTGAADERDMGPVLAHCRDCGACRGILELHRDLVALGAGQPVPGDADFTAMRNRALARTRNRPERRDAHASPDRLAGTRSRGLVQVAVGIAASVVLFLVGLTVGRIVPDGSRSPMAVHGVETRRPGANGGVVGRLVSAMNAEAASNRDLADVEDSRFIYSNVLFRRLDDERVAVDFDVTTHLQLVEPVQSEIVQDVLAQSLLNPSSMGSRLKAMSLASSTMGPKVTESLVFAMRRDPSLAVRLKALTILTDQLENPRVEAAVLDALRDDDAVQVRLLALDALAAHSTDRERIQDAVERDAQPGDRALQVRWTEHKNRL